jgi:cytochrome c oxidase subunit 2
VTPWGSSSSLDPAGPQAGHIAGVWWLFLVVCSVVFVAVLVALALAITRRPGTVDLRRRSRPVAAAVALTVVTLLALLGKSVIAGKALTAMTGTASVNVKVIGRQWWWELQYQADPPSQMVTTANELHIPVGQPVLLQLESRDVIHSFWVPALHGKRDLIPGHPSTTYIRADRPGLFRGQCAEFCGAQHAHMGLLVIAEPPAEFQAWLARARQPAPEPGTDQARRGRELFLRGPCVMCHAVGGTIAAAGAGPDLTHLGARRTLAAGTLPNQHDALSAWLRDAQVYKPGAHMPTLGLPPRELDDVVAYLETQR